MYGVDLMSTSDCQAGLLSILLQPLLASYMTEHTTQAYFAEHGAVQIEWLNDSACNAVFPDAAQAARALVGLGTPLPPEATIPEGSSESCTAVLECFCPQLVQGWLFCQTHCSLAVSSMT